MANLLSSHSGECRRGVLNAMIELIKSESGAAKKFGEHLYFLDLMRNNPDEYYKQHKEYLKVVTNMPSPPLGWDENIASIDRFSEITTCDLFEYPLIIGASRDEIKSHFLKNLFWEKPLVWGRSINLLAGVIHELNSKFIIPDKNKIYDRASKHFLNSSLRPISAHHLSKEVNFKPSAKSQDIIDEIMKFILK